MENKVKELILDGTKYVSGSVDIVPDDAFSISASQLGKEDLQVYLQMIYGNQPETEISDATLGTIFHKGMECMALEAQEDQTVQDQILIEHSMAWKLPNEWWFTGTADLVHYNGSTFYIHDYKLTKNYTVKMFRKNVLGHTYGLQMSGLAYLAGKNLMTKDDSVSCTVDFFLKDSNKMKFEPVHVPVTFAPLLPATVEELIVEKTNRIQDHIVNATIPPECKDTWIRKVGGQTVKTMCEFYCSQKNNCPYYKKKEQYKNSNVNLIASWG